MCIESRKLRTSDGLRVDDGLTELRYHKSMIFLKILKLNLMMTGSLLAVLLTGTLSPAQVVEERRNVRLWDEQNLHVTTRPHNRMLVHDPDTGNLFAFFGIGNTTKQNLYRVSRDGVNWTPARLAINGNGHGSSQDYLRVGKRIYAIFFPVTGDPNIRNYLVTDFTISGSELIPGATHVAIPGTAVTSHFYGSLARDADGYLWIGSRGVDRGTPETQTAFATRSVQPDDHSEWGQPVAVSPPNEEGNAVPDMVALEGGRVLAVSYLGVNYWEQPNGMAELYVSLYEPGEGWSPPYRLMEASNSIRSVAEYDPASRRVHLLYGDPAGNLRHRTLEAPHGRADWSPSPGTLVAGAVKNGTGVEFDISFGLDHTRSPAGIWVAYLQQGLYELRYFDGEDWTPGRYSLDDNPTGPHNEATMLRDVSERVGLVYTDDEYVTYGELILATPTPSPTVPPTPTTTPAGTPTASPTPSPTPPPSPTSSADFNGDGVVDEADLRVLYLQWKHS